MPPMKSRHRSVMILACALTALGTLIASALADELIGVITKVDVEGKKLTVIEKDTDKKVDIKVTEDTKYVTSKGRTKIDLEKLDRSIKKIRDQGKKGISVKVIRQDDVATQIFVHPVPPPPPNDCPP
jgi:hypothetical protein